MVQQLLFGCYAVVCAAVGYCEADTAAFSGDELDVVLTEVVLPVFVWQDVSDDAGDIADVAAVDEGCAAEF